MSPEKRCADCHVRKPLAEFWRDRSQPDGRDCSCIQCRKKRRKDIQRQRAKGKPSKPFTDGANIECKQCGEIKPVSEFYASPQTVSGYLGQCKACLRANRRARRGTVRPPRHERYFDGAALECTKCERVLPLSEFHRDRTAKFGYSQWCKACRKLTRGHAEGTYNPAFKQELIDLLGGKCAICGFDTYLTALQFHHVDPDDKNTLISKLLKRYNEICQELLDELDKCCLLCANCHQALHAHEIDVVYAKRSTIGWYAQIR